MHFYSRFRGADLPRSVGVDTEDGFRRSEGRAGVLSYGPYLTLGPGNYTAAFYVRRQAKSDGGDIEFDVACNHGSRTLASRLFPVGELMVSIAGMLKLDFSVDAPVRAWEARLRAPSDFFGEIRELVLYRRDPGNWGM